MNLRLLRISRWLKETSEKWLQRENSGTAIARFGSIHHLVNNAGIFVPKPFTAYTIEDFRRLCIDQLGRVPLHHPTGSEADADSEPRRKRNNDHCRIGRKPDRRWTRVGSNDYQGRPEFITLSLASEYARKNIRFNAVAPGAVNTPMHEKDDMDHLKSRSPMGTISESEDYQVAGIVDKLGAGRSARVHSSRAR